MSARPLTGVQGKCMTAGTVETVLESVGAARGQFYPLLLIVGPRGAGKTALLSEVAGRMGIDPINVNLELSERLIPLRPKQRALQASRLLEEMVPAGGTAFLDNLEMLFDPALQLDPLVCLQQVARRTGTTIVATWNGTVDGERLSYAAPGHPEWRQYRTTDVLWVRTEQAGRLAPTYM